MMLKNGLVHLTMMICSKGIEEIRNTNISKDNESSMQGNKTDDIIESLLSNYG